MAEPLPDSEDAPATTASTADNGPPRTFTLLVVSPSPEVTNPLRLEQLPLEMTVKQLKAKIRDSVSTRPDDAAQRLIHRGRMLRREDETMLEVFGQQTVGLNS